MPDIDIDFLDRNTALNILEHRVAMRVQKEEMVKHNTGVYFQEIPYNPFTNLTTIEYEAAESRGYFKIDFLNVGLYNGVKDEDHLKRLLDTEPLWDLLEHREIVEKLFHISDHYSIVRRLKPTSIEQLAAVLAIIRPAKRYLEYHDDWNAILKEVWIKPTTSELYFFKKSHAIAYACAIVVQLNLICEQVSWDYA